MINDIIKNNEFLKNSSIKEIKKGYSFCTKYILRNHKSYLIKIFKKEKFNSYKKVFDTVSKLSDNKYINKFIKVKEEDDYAYIISEFFSGNDLEEVINTYSDQEQYELGYIAGGILSEINEIDAPNEISSWYDRKVKKHEYYLKGYRESKYSFKNDEKVLDFICKNINLMKDRPNKLQHDDFHLANIIIKDNKINGIIDFDSMDWGDPVHEFVKLGTITQFISIPFSIGQIDGYLKEKPSEKFWKLYSLYHGMVAIASVVWTEKYYPDDLDDEIKNINVFLNDFDYFDSLIPKWYVNNDFTNKE